MLSKAPWDSWARRLFCPLFVSLASLVAQTVKRLPAMWETGVRSLGREDPLGKEMTTYSQYSCLENPVNRGAW